MDRSRVCTEYWDSRPYSRPQEQIPQTSQYKVSGKTFHSMSEEKYNQVAPGNSSLPRRVDSMLRGLFKKASQEELNTLHGILSYNDSTADRGLVTQLLSEEIHNRPRWFIIWSDEDLRDQISYDSFLTVNSVPAPRLQVFCTQPDRSLTKKLTWRKEKKRKIRKRKASRFSWYLGLIRCS